MKLGEELQQAGAPNLMTKLSGQALSSNMPRGLQGLTAGGAIAGGAMMSNPMAIPAVVASMPRVVGEGALLTGRVASGVGKAGGELSDIIDASNIDPKLLANYLYQAQQPKEIP
jgi:hypothetical protein